jgi:hypothetical protein
MKVAVLKVNELKKAASIATFIPLRPLSASVVSSQISESLSNYKISLVICCSDWA